MLILLGWLYSQICVLRTPVVPKKVSAITRCPLYNVLDFLGKKIKQELRWRIFFTIRVKSLNYIYFKI